MNAENVKNQLEQALRTFKQFPTPSLANSIRRLRRELKRLEKK